MNKIERDFKLFAKDKGLSTFMIDDAIRKTENSLTPVILEERQMNVAPLDIYSRLLYDRQIFFGHDFNTETCNLLVAQLLYLDSVDNRDINIMINSPGGSVSDGIMVIDTMNFIKSDVSTTCVGMAASMGSVLLSNGTKGKRFCLPHASVMLHQPSGGFRGKASDMKIEWEEMQKCEKMLYEILSQNLNKPYDEIVEICKQDSWYHGEEALKLGIVDKIITKQE